MHPIHPRQRFQTLVPLLLLAACGESLPGPKEGAGEIRGGANVSAVQRVESEPVRSLRRALDLGLLEAARAQLEAIEPEPLGLEWPLLQARLAALSGKDLEVTPLIEAARSANPKDPRVYAAAAELHAAAGRLETAREELSRGLEACGVSPELLRAQGVLELCRQGQAQRGLALFERALTYDAQLPFTLRARAQGHLLLAKQAFGEQRIQAALSEVRRSLEFDSGDPDARLFFSDVLAATGDFPSAVQILQELVAAGMQRESELAGLYKRAAMGELVLGNRSGALEYFRLAREAGLTPEELGSGTDLLHEAALASMREGVQAFAAEDLEAARTHFEQGLRYDDSLLVLHSQLAVVLYRQEHFLPAATQWREVLDRALEEQLVLPDPTHIFLAKALYAADEKRAAKKVLKAYIEREPQGRWVEATSALISELE